MRLHAVSFVAALALAGCAEGKMGTGDQDAEVKIDGAPRADATPHVDATPAADAESHIDAPPGAPDAMPSPPDAPPATSPDTCAGANDLTAAAMSPTGASVDGDTTGYANDTQPASSCTGYTPDGPDAIYKVTVAAGQTITAIVFPDIWDASIFISSDCTLAAMCLVGADDSPFPGDFEGVEYTATAAGTYYIVVESWDPGDYGGYTLEVLVD